MSDRDFYTVSAPDAICMMKTSVELIIIKSSCFLTSNKQQGVAGDLFNPRPLQVYFGQKETCHWATMPDSSTREEGGRFIVYC